MTVSSSTLLGKFRDDGIVFIVILTKTRIQLLIPFFQKGFFYPGLLRSTRNDDNFGLYELYGLSTLRTIFLHLHRDEHIHLRGIFEGKLPDDGREEPVYDHGFRRLLVDSAAPHVEEGFLGDLAGTRLVRHGGRTVPDPNIRKRIALGTSI